MPASHAQVPTTRARRYLTQLCRHGRRMGQPGLRHAHGRGHDDGGEPPVPRPAGGTGTDSGADGMIDFGWGRCTLRATSDALTLRAEAGDQDQLQRIQDGIAARLERIGRRDRLTVTWEQAAP
jgi:hypothetical protein